MLLEEIALMITGAIQITGGKMKATVVVDNIGTVSYTHLTLPTIA